MSMMHSDESEPFSIYLQDVELRWIYAPLQSRLTNTRKVRSNELYYHFEA